MIACGGDYTIIQNEKDEIYVCGSNLCGQLGLGDDENRDKFEKANHNTGEIKNIACGGDYTIIQNKKNEVYVCGWNCYGQLGLGDNYDRDRFEKVARNFGEIKKIACGNTHTIIQNEKNEIYVCGDNRYGQLGLGNNINNINKFGKVKYNFGEIKNIACGGYHTVILNKKNEIYVCGLNDFGQLGLGNNIHRYKFEKVGKNFGEIKNIVCGKNYTVVQNEKNELYVCGDNEYGQLGLSDLKYRDKFEKVKKNFGEIKNVACGKYHTVIQNIKNEVYVCGYNGWGQLGLGDNKNKDKFEKVEKNFGEIKNIVCGDFHTIIQNKKNEIYVCGANNDGQLGLGDNEDRNTFEKVNTDDIFEKIYNFVGLILFFLYLFLIQQNYIFEKIYNFVELKINTEEIVL